MLSEILPGKILLLFVLLFAGCDKSKQSFDLLLDESGEISSVRIPSDELIQQGIVYDYVEVETFNNWIDCSGYIAIPPEKKMIVSSPVSGKIVSVMHSPGNRVLKGSTLLFIESNDVIDLQYKYLNAKNQYELYSEEYKRQGELTVENATAMKTFQTSRYDFQAAELLLNASHLHLQLIGINADSLKLHNMSSVITIKAPQQGVISEIYVHTGQYIQSGNRLYEIYKPDDLLLKLNIPGQCIESSIANKNIKFVFARDSLSVYETKVLTEANYVGKDNIAAVYCTLPETDEKPIPGLPVVAQINISTDTIYVVSQDALHTNDNKTYFYIKQNDFVKKIPVPSYSVVNNKILIPETFGLSGNDTILKGRIDYLDKIFLP